MKIITRFRETYNMEAITIIAASLVLFSGVLAGMRFSAQRATAKMMAENATQTAKAEAATNNGLSGKTLNLEKCVK